ncbi:MAG: Smr/MutS family protein [Candidatus Cloacimonetes bacterium]|nr:Smr/MutS family protein [Candidatus Cloacimonadota bacterium]
MKCPVCGNELETGCQVCPWCESPLKAVRRSAAAKEKIRCRNIKSDQPTIELALSRLQKQLYGAKADGVRILKIVHGYGSSGKGGDIRYAVRELLQGLRYTALINCYIPGEQFGGNYEEARRVAGQFPVLKRDSDWNKGNQGITIILLGK